MKLSEPEILSILLENRKMRFALQRIEKWHGEFPSASFQGREVSYALAYGSNGERDFMRNIATEALK